MSLVINGKLFSSLSLGIAAAAANRRCEDRLRLVTARGFDPDTDDELKRLDAEAEAALAYLEEQEPA